MCHDAVSRTYSLQYYSQNPAEGSLTDVAAEQQRGGNKSFKQTKKRKTVGQGVQRKDDTGKEFKASQKKTSGNLRRSVLLILLHASVFVIVEKLEG